MDRLGSDRYSVRVEGLGQSHSGLTGGSANGNTIQADRFDKREDGGGGGVGFAGARRSTQDADRASECLGKVFPLVVGQSRDGNDLGPAIGGSR